MLDSKGPLLTTMSRIEKTSNTKSSYTAKKEEQKCNYNNSRSGNSSSYSYSNSNNDSTSIRSLKKYMNTCNNNTRYYESRDPAPAPIGSTNSMVEDNFNHNANEDADNNVNSSSSSNGTGIKQFLMKLTCHQPLGDSLDPIYHQTTPSTTEEEIYYDPPSLANLHKELQQRFITTLQQDVHIKDKKILNLQDKKKELEVVNSIITQDLKQANQQVKNNIKTRLHLDIVERVNSKLHESIASNLLELKEADDDQTDIRTELQGARFDLRQVEHDKSTLVRELRRRGDCDKELRATNSLLRTAKQEADSMKVLNKEEMKEMEKKHEDKVLNLQVQLRALKIKYGQPDDGVESEAYGEAELKAIIQIKNESVVALRDQVMASETTRRKLHNVIQELRGNIRVFVRVRPFLENEIQMNRMRQIVTPINVVETGNAVTICGKHETTTFEFDKVYGPTAAQEYVFEELSDFVQSALDGYSACIFAYGQTGSGKTHTMQGEGVGSMRGITPRAVEQILKAGNLMKHTWNFYVQANFVEIYNEKLVDLLSDIKEEIEFFNSCEDEILTLNPGINKGSDKLILRKDVLGQTFVEGLTNVMIDINDYDRGMAMINSILKCAARARTVASTKMNDRSSRSHSVFTLDIAGRNLQSGAVTAGSLHLVDLAGSERLDSMENQVDAQQLKETTNINKSLSCLGDVFSALASDAGHVPYRNSKLTYLLQNCLGGDGKACMVVNLSPDIASSNESLQSLRFAQRVSQIELGRGTKKVHLAK